MKNPPPFFRFEREDFLKRSDIGAGTAQPRIAEKFAEPVAAPILYIHRHDDGYISFATERDGEDFRPLVSIRASELETWFPGFRDQLLKDGYVGINADWRLRSFGPHGDSYGYPLHQVSRLRYLNACFVDVDFHKLGLDLGAVIGRVINLQDSGQLPHASMLVRSGHGLWLLWFIHDVESRDVSQRAFPDKLELYARIQAAIIERLLPLGADMAARDAARHLRLAGSLNSGAEKTVEWWIQGADEGGYIYTLPELARLFKATPTRRHHGELVAHNPAKRRGWVALNARRLRDFNTLRALRGGFGEGCRNNAAKIYAWLLRCNAISKPDVLGLLRVMGSQCRPPLSNGEIKGAWKYRKILRMRDQLIANWLLVTTEEAAVLEGLPAAGAMPVPRIRGTERARIDERRAAIQVMVAEIGSTPSVRRMAALLKARGIAVNHMTVRKDYGALGIQRTRTEKPRTQGILFPCMHQTIHPTE